MPERTTTVILSEASPTRSRFALLLTQKFDFGFAFAQDDSVGDA